MNIAMQILNTWHIAALLPILYYQYYCISVWAYFPFQWTMWLDTHTTAHFLHARILAHAFWWHGKAKDTHIYTHSNDRAFPMGSLDFIRQEIANTNKTFSCTSTLHTNRKHFTTKAGLWRKKKKKWFWENLKHSHCGE